MTIAHAATLEAIAELLDDPLPPDWQDPLARQVRRDHLTVLAYDASEAAIEVLIHQIEKTQRGERVTAVDAPVRSMVDNLISLDRGWRQFVHDTQSNADDIVHDAATFWAGSLIATYVEGMLDRMRAAERRAMRELCGAPPAAESA